VPKIKIIKTLPHTHPLFLTEGRIVYGINFSEGILETIESIVELRKEDIKFSGLLTKLSQIRSFPKNPNILDEFRVTELKEFKRVDIVENVLDFSIKGDIISLWPIGYDNPIRIEFFGEDCESIYIYDKLINKKLINLDSILITEHLPEGQHDIEEVKIIDDNSKTEIQKIIFTQKPPESLKTYNLEPRNFINTDFKFPGLYFSNFKILQNEIERLEREKFSILVKTIHSRDLPEWLEKYRLRNITPPDLLSRGGSGTIPSLERGLGRVIGAEILNSLSAGFISNELKIAFLTDKEIFGTIYLNKSQDKSIGSSRIKKLLRAFEGEIEMGNYVVHEDYGVGIYNGLIQQTVDYLTSDYLHIQFAENDELYVPLTQINKITKYLGSEGMDPQLTRLGKGSWQALKAKVRASVYISAKELIEHFAKRELSKAKGVYKEDSKEYLEFENNFKHIETKDQITSINEVISDLQKNKPMNRLLVGDVGFGKTEVIMRAAFKVVENGGQVLILAPTTVLVAQHYKVFKERFNSVQLSAFSKKLDSPNIEFVSRFHSPSKNREIVEKTNNGKVDILIGTHRLLSSDINLNNLQLLVVDEEQRFGVKQKEKIKKINYGTHVLSVSATPIPRTLSLALSSIQDISIITTPPEGRQSIETEIIYEDWSMAANAIIEEMNRGGQVYFIHNRIASITGIKSKLLEMIPNLRIEVAHGQMNAEELDTKISNFYLEKYDILLCTSIVENGLDLPNVNTIIIHDAHTFGLSQLYQLRGRVGRSSKKAFCYLMAPKVKKSEVQVKENYDVITRPKTARPFVDRLQTLVDNQDLGAGFKIASKDLELRGAGNLLGGEQHGHISKIGYALYIEMLGEEIEKLKSVNL